MILDLFAGPGGWDQGLAMLGYRDVLGIEFDDAACRTAIAAGHPRLMADIAHLPIDAVVDAYGPFAGLIASPPCQAWSMAGNRKGERDREMCHHLADRFAEGDVDEYQSWPWEDPRSPLVCQPVRWARELRPDWIALEEVPAVASLWEHFARIFRSWGYSVWTGDLNAADYGVPQTRTRRILIARRNGTAHPPAPTHAANPQPGADLFGDELKPWVTMAEALGWEAPIAYRASNQANAAVRTLDEPAPTVLFGARSNKVEWVPSAFVSAGVTGEGRPKDPHRQPADTLTGKGTAYWVHERPATTVVGSFRPDIISAPGYRTDVSRQDAEGGVRVTVAEGGVRVTVAEGGVRVTVAEGGVLQSFPPDYPWQGSKTKQYQQVGNAVPPLLAAHVVAAAIGTDVHLRAGVAA